MRIRTSNDHASAVTTFSFRYIKQCLNLHNIRCIKLEKCALSAGTHIRRDCYNWR
jgi:hypothetical protein